MSLFKNLAIIFSALVIVACTNDTPPECAGTNGVKKNDGSTKNISDGEFVKSAYQTILQRPADAQGLSHHCNLLNSQKADRIAILQGLMGSEEFRSLTAPK